MKNTRQLVSENKLRVIIRNQIRHLFEADDKQPQPETLDDDIAKKLVSKINSALTSAGIQDKQGVVGLFKSLISDKPNTAAAIQASELLELILTTDAPPQKVGAAIATIVKTAQDLRQNKTSDQST